MAMENRRVDKVGSLLSAIRDKNEQELRSAFTVANSPLCMTFVRIIATSKEG